MKYGVPTDIVNYCTIKGQFPCAQAKQLLGLEIPQKYGGRLMFVFCLHDVVGLEIVTKICTRTRCHLH
jgi:hypothetical protein